MNENKCLLKNWQTETIVYLPRLEAALRRIDLQPPFPKNIPPTPFDTPPSLLQAVIYSAATFYELDWYRTRETIEAITMLWRKGYVSAAASLIRPVFELWGATHYMTEQLRIFYRNKNIDRLAQVVRRLATGARSEVLLPWGTPTTEQPIHVLDTIRSLSAVFPDAMTAYEALCESTHANQPRYLEWWFLGKTGDNWTNKTVQTRGHALIIKTIDIMEKVTTGIKTEIEIGMRLCGELY
jgi:hypothetical protein